MSRSEESEPAASKAELPRVRWEGAQFIWHSLAHVNRELCLRLLKNKHCELSLIPTEMNQFQPPPGSRFEPLVARCFAPLSGPADVEVRHSYPPRFQKPHEGHFVLMQPWEYGYLPMLWADAIRDMVTEAWCNSRYEQEIFRASGIPEEKIQLIPLGVDTDIFCPEAMPYVFTTEPGAKALQGHRKNRFVFLFVGGTLPRKGIDILLDAYRNAFSAYDDVCLVIKDMGTRTIYRQGNERERILALANGPTRPPVVYLEDDLSAHQLAGLYATADCVVQPYRGEGFCLPALEALACGRPVLVPAGGPTDDFIDETVGWRLPAEKRPFGNGKIGIWDCVGPTWMWEISVDALAHQMREVYRQPEEAARRGAAGRQRALESWTWQHSCATVEVRLHALKQQPVTQEVLSVPALSAKVTSPTAQDTVPGETAPAIPVRPQPTISLCMIVKNEERVLGDCLKSIKPWVDEIIIVDTGSTDCTVEIAKEAGAQVFHFAWCDDFAAARNESIRHATGDWIFWMDADDTIPEACGRKLREIAFLAEDRTGGFLMQVHIPPQPGGTGTTVVDHVKLFRNRPQYRFEGRIHEQIMEPILQNGGLLERADAYVNHSGYDFSAEGQLRKRHRDMRILKKEAAERPNQSFVHYNIGMTYYHMKEYEQAIAALERCLELARPFESPVRKAYAFLVGCYYDQGKLDKSREWLEKGLALFPRDPELLFRAGILYQAVKDLPAAERSYLTLLNEREVGHIDSMDVSITTFKTHHNLAALYVEARRFGEAERQLHNALNVNPMFVPSLLVLAELYLSSRRFDDAGAIIARAMAVAPTEAQALQMRLAQARDIAG